MKDNEKILLITALMGLFILALSVHARPCYSATTIYFRSKCSDVGSNQTQCTASGCYWWDDSCHPYPAIANTDYCYKIDDDISYCTTTANGHYLIIYNGEEIGGIVNL